MVVDNKGFRYFFNEKFSAKQLASKINGELFIENTKPYRFIKNGKTCKGSERWLSLDNLGHNID